MAKHDNFGRVIVLWLFIGFAMLILAIVVAALLPAPDAVHNADARIWRIENGQ